MRLVQVDELAEWVAEDINQSDEDADRYIELDSLDKSHSIHTISYLIFISI